ncbi:MAG: 2TM domain-containing protein [Saprospiraceae bacterium]|nr:2TM domain-containing protein [Saprospiraceae bacterium]
MSDMYKLARKRAKQKVKFFKHLKSFVIINSIFLTISYLDGDGLEWLNVTWIWGIFVLFHYLKVFGVPGTDGVLSKRWEEEMEYRELKRMGLDQDEYEELDLREKRREKAARWNENDLV